MNSIEVFGQSLLCEEAADIVIDRPYGIGIFVFLRFHSPMQVLTVQGRKKALPGQCILFDPVTPQWYCGCDGAWLNDWMHIAGEGISELAEQNGIPLNTVLEPVNSSFLPHIFREIAREQHYAETGWEEAVELQVRQLLLQLGRALRDSLANLKPAEAEHLVALRTLRGRIQEHLTHRWTVREMANEVGLSPSRFAALYVRFFGVSPLEDLLRARLRYAQTLLTNRALPIREAALMSGFNSLHYFSHVFHQRIGCAPRDYHCWGKR